MASDESRRQMKPAAILAELERLFAQDLEDAELRARLEELARNWSFNGLTYYWGPILYRRSRVVFRPFILSHFSNYLIQIPGGKPIHWKGKWQADLEAWLAEVDRADDVDLFKRLYRWKLTPKKGWQLDEKAWQGELLRRFEAARQRHERDTVLKKFALGCQLEEEAAIALYRADADALRPFILGHLPRSWYYQDDRRKLWAKLAEVARQQGDEDFYFELYRKQTPLKQWEQDVLRLATEISDQDRLVEALQKRHPDGWGLDVGNPFYRLVEARGRDVLPYVMRHLRNVWGRWSWRRTGYDKMVALALQKQWFDFYSALVRTCARAEEYDREVARLVGSGQLSQAEVERRLLMLTGVSREWNFGPFSLAQVQQLTDKTAMALYARFPHLLRGPFKMHVQLSWGNDYRGLAQKAIGAGDDVLVDYLASRVVGRANRWGYEDKMIRMADELADYYQKLQSSPAEFSRRAIAVLGQVPAYSIWDYNSLIRNNRLARLFFVRSDSTYLEDAASMQDLIEAPEIHVQALAYRALGLDDPRAKELAQANLDMLLATLLRPLHRKTRGLALDALANAATDLASARRINQRARQALDLPDKRYAKEPVIGLIGKLLWQWPELRGPQEGPVIYGESA